MAKQVFTLWELVRKPVIELGSAMHRIIEFLLHQLCDLDAQCSIIIIILVVNLQNFALFG